MMTLLVIVLIKTVQIYSFLIFLRCLLTWFPNVNWENPILNALRVTVDMYLDLFRKFIPPVAGFDFSPIVAFFALGIMLRAIIYLFALLGLI